MNDNINKKICIPSKSRTNATTNTHHPETVATKYQEKNFQFSLSYNISEGQSQTIYTCCHNIYFPYHCKREKNCPISFD